MSDTQNGTSCSTVAQASGMWWAGDRVSAGRLLVESISKESRPVWASRLLDDLVTRSQVRHAALATLLYATARPDQWNKAHSIFSMIRSIGLALDRNQQKTGEQQLLARLLAFGELVAKVTYNATEPTDPFDTEAEWSIAPCYKSILDIVIGEDSTQLAWNQLSTSIP